MVHGNVQVVHGGRGAGRCCVCGRIVLLGVERSEAGATHGPLEETEGRSTREGGGGTAVVGAVVPNQRLE